MNMADGRDSDDSVEHASAKVSRMPKIITSVPHQFSGSSRVRATVFVAVATKICLSYTSLDTHESSSWAYAWNSGITKLQESRVSVQKYEKSSLTFR
ncbi:hypothetical protein AGABI1DRAFT_134214 [Agaricus bisporus var. burnettii JB137-S8]|uniref:Uncharacterized protein n=1 Tax=Agaricus bisporus var. burnettii (strain JB137-S8 / ATCC MYA-4627 / FGSC 10392) TaxID=597362 RepID=K5WEN9_AGABU|nr:uncharacterized protein AGABI1DRAFT_134214 [Agaricus bisporus var. burnettii JB137-S8]XP_007335662.1 uncharacterized protein AGABI1DRAFT_134242 [Agaricus bisporus var. burnettii JB137-S8]EKM73699.1 hypothetical protein AGABI1DRAFT_134242 [Agaricus bisporus var. burnettii JB137-S8]EKM73711.1 hypothetical protein AGABI1DRAFT_134214 [Agaricus bisporus var. burnettii JB137-S8]